MKLAGRRVGAAVRHHHRRPSSVSPGNLNASSDKGSDPLLIGTCDKPAYEATTRLTESLSP